MSSRRLVLLAGTSLLGACSLAPERLPNETRLAGYVTLREASYARIPNAVIEVSRCFRARVLLPSCELVPLAEYRSDELGRFAVFIAVEGFYAFTARACLNGELHEGSQTLEIARGTEMLEPFELQAYFGTRC